MQFPSNDKRKLIKEFEQKPSQDIYYLLNILNLTPICLIENGFTN